MADALWRSFAEVVAVRGGRNWCLKTGAAVTEQASRRRGADSGEDRRSLPWLLVRKWWLPTWCSGVRWPARLVAAAVWRVVGKLGLGFHV
ncbi:hypothetical protein DEO72_LG5g1518 [Vigna unguiculata]|uniref:Uncharacterized protein n=1 Tax=Vigna unguiculata TaxID=3917 RepID=A0A4D6LY76_VIGUN|nr:hypothetical protein DEO72_LG5g1518 [Vigna unguiculata]